MAFDRHYYRALAHGSERQWRKAYREISYALDQGVFDHRALFLKARFLQQSGELEAAKKAYWNALKVHPNYAHSHHNLGGIYASKKDWKPAIAAYRKAVELRPTYFQAQLHLGNAYATTGQFENALDAFQKVVHIRPDLANAHVNIGSVYIQQNKLEKAVAAFQQAVQLDPRATRNRALLLEAERVRRSAAGMVEDSQGLAAACAQPGSRNGR